MSFCDYFLCSLRPLYGSHLSLLIAATYLRLIKFICNHLFSQLEQWWLDIAYLDFRSPLPFINFAGPGPYMNHFLTPQSGTQIERAGILIHLNCKFWHLVRK